MNTSKQAIDCALMQNKTDEKCYSVIYDDQKLQDAELNYSVYEKKLLIIKHAL